MEMALCLPVLFMFLFGCYEIAHANMMMHAAESAAYEAARTGIVPGAQPAAVERAAQRVLGTVGIRDFRVEITPREITNDTERIRVDVHVNFGNNMIAPRLFFRNPTLRGQCELSREVF